MLDVAALRIAVIGCGTGGPAAALLLSRAGHRVELFERVPEPGPVGAGLLLQPTGMQVLRRLGLADQVAALGSPVRRLFGATAAGRVVMDLDYADWHPSAHGLGVHRGILFGALWEALRASDVELRCGVDVIAISPSQRLATATGEQHGPYDLVVCADGARSLLRAGLGLTRRAARYPWGALWAVVPDPDERYAGALSQVYRGTREMVGTLPSGRPNGTPCVSLFWSLPERALARTREAGLDAFRRRVRELTGERLESILAQIDDMDALLWAGYHDVVLRCWHTPDARVAVLGDAGHAMSPQLGQGANLALIDAWTLADCLDVHAGDLAAALPDYSARRRAHLRFYAWASRLLTPVYQSHLGLLAPPRDRLMHPLARLGWLRSQMVATLAGVKTGPFAELDGRDEVLARPPERPPAPREGPAATAMGG